MASPSARSLAHTRLVQSTSAACAVVFAALCYLPRLAQAQSADDAALIAAIDHAAQHREQDLAGYTVDERYTITNSHFSEPATAVVKVTYTRDAGKQYQVVSRTGPSLLASHLLDSMLAEEQKLSRNPDRAASVITSDNYIMSRSSEDDLNTRRCIVLVVSPHHRSAYVLNGRIWVDASTKQLVRIDGIPPVSPSFFASRPTITRDYDEIDGFSLATHSHAVSDAFFTGKTVVDIDYVNYQLAQ